MKKVYRNINRGSRKRDKIVNNVLVLVLIVAGIAITISPVITYATGQYSSEEFHNSIQPGSFFTFVGAAGGYSASSKSPFNYGILINVSFINNMKAEVELTLFSLGGNHTGFNIQLLPKLPFIASSVTSIYTDSFSTNLTSSPILPILFINSTNRNSVIGNLSVNDTSFTSAPYANLGNPQYDYISINGTPTLNYYVIYSNMKVLTDFSLFNGQAVPLMKWIYPYFNSSEDNIANLVIEFGSSNTSPVQDWGAWFQWGFAITFPINVVLIGAGIILYILRFRR